MDDRALRYFPPATDQCPTFVEDSEWTPFVDGAAYLPALSDLLASAGRGDAVSIVGLELDPRLDLHGRSAGDEGYDPLGDRAWPGWRPTVWTSGSSSRPACGRPRCRGRSSAVSAPRPRTPTRLRTLRPDPDRPPPLAGRVLLDHSGALIGSNHQKAVVARIDGELTAFVGGIDLVLHRFDAAPHDTLTLDGERWGWHDMAVRLRGRAAEQVWRALDLRWREASALPRKHWRRRRIELSPLNPDRAVPPPGPPAPARVAPGVPGTAVRVLRSAHVRRIESLLPWRRQEWSVQPRDGYREVFETLTAAFAAARRYIYLEDQYLEELLGGSSAYELFPALRDAAARGVKVILLGSGRRDPEDPGFYTGPINRRLNVDIRRKLVDPLPVERRANVAVYRVEHLTVHAKLVLVDDVFASIGSANLFSRSMTGTDSELCAAIATTTDIVRDLRTAVWGEHLRAPLTPPVRKALEDLDVALGVWRPEWAPERDPLLWREAERPAGFAPQERVLRLVGP